MMRTALALLALMAAAPAAAQLTVDITSGVQEPMPLAVPVFPTPQITPTQAGTTAVLGQQLAAIISNDLGGSGLFRILPQGAFPAPGVAEVTAPRFDALKLANAQGLVTGAVSANANGTLTIGCYLYDVFAGEELVRRSFTTTAAGWRRAAHKCADLVYSRLTGESGYFDSRIIYVAESGPATKRVTRLAVMDQDGANNQFLTSGASLVLMPRFSPVDETIVYMSFANNRPRMMLYNLATGAQRPVGNYDGMSFAGRFSPDGRKVVLSVTRGGNSDIYVQDVGGGPAVRLTRDASINTSPSYSPDGSKIVFESDRGGSQQLYVMNADGSNQHRITFGQGRAGSPVWSPRGDLIAFTRLRGQSFRISVIRPDGSGERMLTDSWQDESPSWSPNGRVVLFTRTARGGSSELRSIDLTGRNDRRIPTPMAASDPSWGPQLK